MPDETVVPARKLDHLRINLKDDVQFAQLTNGLERYRFIPRALPNLNLDDIDLSARLFGKKLRSPLLISSMTGGAEQTYRINKTLATAAQAMGIAMGLGSQRAALEDQSVAYTYQVRAVAPDILLFANLGAIQLNYTYTIDHCRRAVDMIQADALILHLNAIQEAVQAEGNTRWKNLLPKIEKVCRALDVPVIAKEVGFGIAGDTARQLKNAGVAAIDVAGAGGTSWAAVESRRASSKLLRELAEAFWNWGIPTADALVAAKRAAPKLPLIASGGIRDGIEVAKCIALGAQLVGLASPMLKLADVGVEDLIEGIKLINETLRVAMFGIGARNVRALQRTNRLQKIY
ncbi:MAG: type 2 isopentenyl-diphosphate Delta-isomerase [Chloroflexi bacterium]|nr:type 2 isopentenyl-diphosphate Delta-isomerase [Chloroflexota bacterium]